VTGRARAFLAFWYDFVVGDDWRLTAGVVAALIVTALVDATGAPSWWVLPVAVLILLPVSVRRAIPRGPRPPGDTEI
jgi:hypothetical protein